MKIYTRCLGGLLNLFVLLVTALSQITPTSDGCVSPTRFTSCMKTAEDITVACVLAAQGRALIIAACGVALFEDQLNCYLADCWNEVYGCTYQAIAIELDSTTLVTFTGGSIPFYPAPDNAPGGCSCNIGKLYRNFTAAARQATNVCLNSAMELKDVKYIQRCDCCAYSAAFAAFYSFCPDTNANALNLTAALATIPIIELNGKCAGLYDATNCEAQYGLAPAAGGLALSLDNLPAWTGTNPLSTLSGAITSPLGGSIMTWTGVDIIFTVTAETDSSPILTTTAKLSTSIISSGPISTSLLAASATVTSGQIGTGTTGTAATTTGTTTKSGSNSTTRICRSLWIALFGFYLECFIFNFFVRV